MDGGTVNITEYRTRVRMAVGCTADQCTASPGESCSNVYGKTNPVRKVVYTVHDERCLAYWQSQAGSATIVVADVALEYAARPAVEGLCPDCGGSGSVGGRGLVRCERCRGEGRVDELEHSALCVETKGRDKDCPSYFVSVHPDGDGHCPDCHGHTGPDGPYCGHMAGCPGC